MSKNAIKTEVGTLKAVQTKKGKNGEFTVITFTVTRATEDKKYEDVDIDVLYFDNAKAKMAEWAKNYEKHAGKKVVLTYTESEDGKSKFGYRLPLVYGMLTFPATVREDATEEEVMAFDDAFDDFVRSGEVDPDYVVDTAKVESMVEAMTLIKASDSEAAKNAGKALARLYNAEHYIFNGSVARVSRFQNVVHVSFAMPKAKAEDPTVWADASFWGENGDRVEKVLKSKDKAVLWLSNKGEYKGNVTFTGYAFKKL